MKRDKRSLKRWLKGKILDMELIEDVFDENYYHVYIGSYFYLDPCGRYHHILSPNSVRQSCINFWERLDEVAKELSGWITSGEGDATDIFFCLTTDVWKDKSKNIRKYIKRKNKIRDKLYQ